MKNLTIIIFTILISFAAPIAFGQANPYIQVLPTNSGVVAVNATIDIIVTIGNTGTGSIAVSKLRPIIQVPASVTFLASPLQDGLPIGWTILSNTGSQLRICNSADVIPGQTARTILLKIQGVTIAPPTQFTANINFGNGTTCAAGTSVAGDNTADNGAQSSVEVVAAPLPLTLLSFKASLVNCEPILNWITESEINTDRFEIERNNAGNNVWKLAGTITANGSANVKNNYFFTDKNVGVSSEKILYRLKMIDKDGKFTYSSIIPVNISCKTASVSVYPNPIKDGVLNVSLVGFKANTNATLLSASGERLMQTKVNNGTNFINVSTIANGIYILKITDDNGTRKTEKVTILR